MKNILSPFLDITAGPSLSLVLIEFGNNCGSLHFPLLSLVVDHRSIKLSPVLASIPSPVEPSLAEAKINTSCFLSPQVGAKS